MTVITCGLPIVLLVLVFLFRLLIDRKIKLVDFIICVLEFPTNIVFLGISFILAFTISTKDNLETGLLILFIYVIVALLMVLFGRRAVEYLEGNRPVLTGVFGIASYILCMPALFYSIWIVVVGI